MAQDEIVQAQGFEAFGLDPRAPACALVRRHRGQRRTPAIEQGNGVGVRQIERLPVVVRQAVDRRSGTAQRDRERLHRQRQAQALHVRQRAAGGEVAERAIRTCGIGDEADHRRQLQADLQFQVDGHRRRFGGDVVRVVG
jgi:hypothetical protein